MLNKHKCAKNYVDSHSEENDNVLLNSCLSGYDKMICDCDKESQSDFMKKQA